VLANVFLSSRFQDWASTTANLLVLDYEWLFQDRLKLSDLSCIASDGSRFQEIVEPEHPIFAGYRPAGRDGRHAHNFEDGWVVEMEPVDRRGGAPSAKAELLDRHTSTVQLANFTVIRLDESKPLCSLGNGRVLARQFTTRAAVRPAVAPITAQTAVAGYAARCLPCPCLSWHLSHCSLAVCAPMSLPVITLA
jgi:hypothetical protein